MQINKISFKNYRNLYDNEIEFCDGINVIYGLNANGKTNLAEAIWLLTGIKSFRGNKDKELINKNNFTENTRIKGYFLSNGRKQTAEIEIDKKRSAVLNEVKLNSPNELSKSFSAIVFSPTDMYLISDGPSMRRKFLDNAISMLRPKYAKIMSDYKNAVLQRNSVLKDVTFHSELSVMLDLFEQTIAKTGSYIINQRIKYIDALMNELPKIYYGISNNKEELELIYKSSIKGDFTEENIFNQLKESRREDIKNLATSVGPHRDDFEFIINGDDLKIFGSQGQKRSAILSVKLSEAEILKRHFGEMPIIILDDVMSELDKTRQDYILNHIKGSQVFITCCDAQTINILENGKCFYVENGEISEKK